MELQLDIGLKEFICDEFNPNCVFDEGLLN